jgi:hypothetical protein
MKSAAAGRRIAAGLLSAAVRCSDASATKIKMS